MAITAYETKEMKLNAPLRGLPKDVVIPVRVDKNGIPLDMYWRRRIKDSEIDGCVEFVNNAKAKRTKVKEKNNG